MNQTIVAHVKSHKENLHQSSQHQTSKHPPTTYSTETRANILEADIFEANILIVDDSIDNLHFLRVMLQAHGYQVRTALAGKLALQAIEQAVPDLMLLDIHMPGMGGFDVLQQLKQSPKTANLPVIFISAPSAIEDKVRGFDYGCVDYITKPFRLEEILMRVKTQLDLSHQRKTLEKLRERDLARFQRINELKDYVIQTASHDLKNPLASITLTGQLLRRHRRMEPNQIDAKVERILASIEQMQNLITDLLDFVQVESGFVKNAKVVQIDSFLCQQIDAFSLIAQEREITLQQGNIAPNLQATFDPGQISQVLSNLISNAIKYTPAGGYVQINSYATCTAQIVFSVSRYRTWHSTGGTASII
ncbi:MAG: response regulator [Chloroflexota bacterium]